MATGKGLRRKRRIVWAVLIVAVIAAGFALFLAGLVIAVPVIGHATWHAYRDLVRVAA